MVTLRTARSARPHTVAAPAAPGDRWPAHVRAGQNGRVTDSAPAREHAAGPPEQATIFVNIASYRDRELPRTFASASARARHPERLRFGICWQFDDATEHDLDPYLDDPRVSIDRVPYADSHGCTWARSRASGFFRDEDYYLQIDAHMRFADEWDATLVDMIRSIDAAKPLITVYPHGYVTDGAGHDELSPIGELHVLELESIDAHLRTRLRTRVADDQERPGMSPFVAAGFLFAPGSFCREVPYDPFGYFSGEEIALAARAHTWGYDFFHPSRHVIWHRYDHGEPLHWADRDGAIGEYEERARERLSTLLVGDAHELGPYGLGPHRTRDDFAAACGVDFTAVAFGDGLGRVETLRIDLELDTDGIPAWDDYEVWVFAVFDVNGRQLHRDDIYDPRILNGESTHWSITAPFEIRPAQYLLWPKRRDGEWGERRVRDLPASSVTPAPEVLSRAPGSVS